MSMCRTTWLSRSATKIFPFFAVEPDFVRCAEQGCFGLPSISGMPLRPCTCDDVDTFGRQIESQNAIATEIRPVKIAVRTNHEAVRLIDLRGFRRRSIRSGAHNARSNKSANTPARLRQEHRRCQQHSTRL